MPEITEVFYPQNRKEWRIWLENNHQSKTEVWLQLWRKDTGKFTLPYDDLVEECLCFGWIDGIRRKIDEERYCIRFTPRREKSHWSSVNIKKVEKLKKEKLMYPAGIKAFDKMDPENAKKFAYEQKNKIVLRKDLEQQIKANKKAWNFFNNLAPGYKKLTI